MFDATNGQFSSNDLAFVESEEYLDPRAVGTSDEDVFSFEDDFLTSLDSVTVDMEIDYENAIWAVELDNTGNIDVMYAEEDIDVDYWSDVFGDYDNEFTGLALISFDGSHWVFEHDDYPHLESFRAKRLEADDSIDSYLPSFSSRNRTNVRKTNRFENRKNNIPTGGRKPAKHWVDGKRLRKTSAVDKLSFKRRITTN